MLPQATAAESASMRSDAVAAGAVPLLANVLKDGKAARSACLLACRLPLSCSIVVLVKVLQQRLSFFA